MADKNRADRENDEGASMENDQSAQGRENSGNYASDPARASTDGQKGGQQSRSNRDQEEDSMES